MSATLRKMTITNGVCGVIHTAASDESRTLCGRDASNMLTLTGMGPWELVGWEASAKGPCQRCTKRAAQAPAVTPIVVDSTPAGIFTAMMRANATDAHGLVELLGAYLRRTLARTYGTVAAKHVYVAITSSGEASEKSIAYGLESVQYGATEDVMMRDLRTGDTVSTDVGPVLLVADSGERGLLSVRHFTGRILSVPSVPDHCTWILRSNVQTSHTVDYWAVQGVSSRQIRRYR